METPPQEVDMSKSGTAWHLEGEPGQWARVIGKVQGRVKRGAVQNHVIIARFKQGLFHSFQVKREVAFLREWQRVDAQTAGEVSRLHLLEPRCRLGQVFPQCQ